MNLNEFFNTINQNRICLSGSNPLYLFEIKSINLHIMQYNFLIKAPIIHKDLKYANIMIT